MLDLGFFTVFSTTTALLLACWGLGRLLVPRTMVGSGWLWHLALRIGWGLLFLAGISATWFSGRFCYGTLIPLLQVLALGWWLRRNWKAGRQTSERPQWHQVVWVALVWPLCALFVSWQYVWNLPDGVRSLHSDLGYTVQLALGFPLAEASSHWSAALGSAAVDGSSTADVWYHWGPVWLAAGLGEVTRLPGLVLMYRMIASVLSFELLLLAAVLVQRLAGTGAPQALLAGAASLIGVQWIKMFGVLWFSEWLPYGALQHSRLSLWHHFPYQFEGMVILMAIAAWQYRQMALAALILYFAGLCAPHNVAVMGAATGTLLGVGVLLRRRDLWRPALGMVLVLLAAWGTLRWAFHVDLPKAPGQSLMVLEWQLLLGRMQGGIRDACVGLLLELLLLPGLIHLIRQPGNHEARVLGWLALCALFGSYFAYHLLRHVSDAFHFTMLAHAVLVMPISLWGWICLWQKSEGARRWVCVGAISLSAGMGLHDLWHDRSRDKPLPFTVAEMRDVKEKLEGRPMGYFAGSDRQWWISKYSTLASFLDARCVRLNSIASVDGDSHSKYYGATRPRELVPEKTGETQNEWSLRLAKRLNVRHVIETDEDPLPIELKSRTRQIAGGNHLRLYEVSPPEPSTAH